MGADEGLAAFPPSFPATSREGDRTYVRRDGCFAVHARIREAAGLRRLYRLENEGIDVLEGTTDALPAGSGAPVAVYGLGEEGEPAVPTGRVSVTFATRSTVPDLADTPYEIESRPAYAPEAAWLVAKDGDVARALRELPRLAARQDIASFEAQLLRPAARRR